MSATIDTDHSQRFAQKSAEATLGYAYAGYFAGIYAFNEMIEAWTEACAESTKTPNSSSKSWFRSPAKANLFDPSSFWTLPTSSRIDPWSEQNWMTQAWWMPLGTLTPAAWPAPTPWSYFLPTLFNTNTDLSFTRSPFWSTASAALPMTWSLMSFGMPHSVAKPTAEANAAALEAIDSIQQVTNDHMAAYNTEMEPVSNKALSDKASNPFDAFTMMFWPWLSDAPKSESPAAA